MEVELDSYDVNIFSVGAYDMEVELGTYNVKTFSVKSILLKCCALLTSEPGCSLDWEWYFDVVLVDGKEWSKIFDAIIPGDCIWWIRLDEDIGTFSASMCCFSDPIWWEDKGIEISDVIR